MSEAWYLFVQDDGKLLSTPDYVEIDEGAHAVHLTLSLLETPFRLRTSSIN
jgi:hypothetical protein